jgi:hypothetical protein
LNQCFPTTTVACGVVPDGIFFPTFNAIAVEQIISIGCFYGTRHKYNKTSDVSQPYILREPTQKTTKFCCLLKEASRIRLVDSDVSEVGVNASSWSHNKCS